VEQNHTYGQHGSRGSAIPAVEIQISVKLHTFPVNKSWVSAEQKAGDGGFTGPLRMIMKKKF
jgi:hypothetical protein